MPQVEVIVESNFGVWRKNVDLDFVPSCEFSFDISERFTSADNAKLDDLSLREVCIPKVRIGKPLLITVAPEDGASGSEEDDDFSLAHYRKLYMIEAGWEEIE